MCTKKNGWFEGKLGGFLGLFEIPGTACARSAQKKGIFEGELDWFWSHFGLLRRESFSDSLCAPPDMLEHPHKALFFVFSSRLDASIQTPRIGEWKKLQPYSISIPIRFIYCLEYVGPSQGSYLLPRICGPDSLEFSPEEKLFWICNKEYLKNNRK